MPSGSFKNVILITIDCLRADHVNIYGYDKLTTPNLNSIARQGTVFLKAFANGPNTASSFISLFTSTYPLMYGNYYWLREPRIPISYLLKQANFLTIGIHSNTYLSAFFNYDKGFDIFIDLTPKESRERDKEPLYRIISKRLPFNIRRYVYNKLKNIERRLFKSKPYADAPTVYSQLAKVMEFVRHRSLHNNKRGIFLWVHFMDVHMPSLYTKANKSNTWSIIDAYDQSIRVVDKVIKEMLDYLLEDKLFRDSSMVIITADHGQELFDHGGQGHGHALYDELIRVPLIILPALEINHEVIANHCGLVQLLDVPPFILHSLGLSQIKPKTFLGREDAIYTQNGNEYIFSEVLLREDVDERPIYLRKGRPLYCIRSSKWKLIYDQHRKKFELYNIEEDPKERLNVLHDNPEVFDSLVKRLIEHIRFEHEESLRIKIKALRKTMIKHKTCDIL